MCKLHSLLFGGVSEGNRAAAEVPPSPCLFIFSQCTSSCRSQANTLGCRATKYQIAMYLHIANVHVALRHKGAPGACRAAKFEIAMYLHMSNVQVALLLSEHLSLPCSKI